MAGPTGVIFASADPVAPAKALKQFSDDVKPLPVKAGYVDGQIIDAAAVAILAALPPKNELQAKVLGLLSSPLRGLVGVLAANPSGFARVLAAREKQLAESALKGVTTHGSCRSHLGSREVNRPSSSTSSLKPSKKSGAFPPQLRSRSPLRVAHRTALRRRRREKTEFDAVLTEIGAEKIKVIKAVRELTSLGLTEAKAFVESAPKAIKTGVPRDEAEQIKAKLAEVGATVDIR